MERSEIVLEMTRITISSNLWHQLLPWWERAGHMYRGRLSCQHPKHPQWWISHPRSQIRGARSGSESILLCSNGTHVPPLLYCIDMQYMFSPSLCEMTCTNLTLWFTAVPLSIIFHTKILRKKITHQWSMLYEIFFKNDYTTISTMEDSRDTIDLTKDYQDPPGPTTLFSLSFFVWREACRGPSWILREVRTLMDYVQGNRGEWKWRADMAGIQGHLTSSPAVKQKMTHNSLFCINYILQRQ